MLRLKRTDAANADFLALVAMLDRELQERDGEEHGFYAQFNKPVGLAGVVVAYDGDEPVGIGAFKAYEDGSAEIKRMYVNAEKRGLRIGASILGELESWAAEAGFHSCILETGFKQPEAIALYKRSGYQIIPNYGQYAGVANSVCMQKSIMQISADRD